MPHHWPQGSVFSSLVLEVEDRDCPKCFRFMNICDHRHRRLFTLGGPLRITSKLVHCPDPSCLSRPKTFSPEAELSIAPPLWVIGWDVFCWIGHRRFARHWSVPQIRGELADSCQIHLSEDAVEKYIHRHQVMVAAWHQDPRLLAEAYRDVDDVILSIDGLQPEKGHETLYVVRELRQRRVWFAQSLLSATDEEVRRLLERAGTWAEALGKPVRAVVSDKQEGIVKAVAQVFPGVPHRYCQNHFLRDLARPMLAEDSSAKVQMRHRVRGLRSIEREVLEERRKQQEAREGAGGAAKTRESKEGPGCDARPGAQAKEGGDRQGRVAKAAAVAGNGVLGRGGTKKPPVEARPKGIEENGAGRVEARGDEGNEVVLDYCASVRGILNGDQGGPLHPPGVKMADDLAKVRASIQRDLDAKKGAPRKNV